MKKSILICGLALVGFTSCKKTWTCECIQTLPGVSGKYLMSFPDQRKSYAKTMCKDHEETNKPGYVLNGGDLSCNIK